MPISALRNVQGIKTSFVTLCPALNCPQGYNQAARELLNEAHLSTKAFDDKYTEAVILKNLAKLSLQEANCGQAINLLKEAQVRSWVEVEISTSVEALHMECGPDYKTV